MSLSEKWLDSNILIDKVDNGPWRQLKVIGGHAQTQKRRMSKTQYTPKMFLCLSLARFVLLFIFFPLPSPVSSPFFGLCGWVFRKRTVLATKTRKNSVRSVAHYEKTKQKNVYFTRWRSLLRARLIASLNDSNATSQNSVLFPSTL